VTVATTALAVRWGLTGVALGFACVAVAATVARWLLVSRMLALPVRAVARPFRIVLLSTAPAAVVGVLVVQGMSGAEWPIATLVTSVGSTLAVNLILTRLFAASVLRDALGILPVPPRHATRLHRLLRLDTAAAAPGDRLVDGAGSPG
jgi:protein-S-isoprenylcysteine O-methyltransferase Ste14